MPPKVLQKNNADRASGVLPVPASARQPQAPKQPATRLKLEVRRLPPGLTLTEFEETLGEEWKLGAGKIDWREYRQGKLKSPGKLPEQSRCYVHLTGEALVKEFEQRFLSVVFHDKAGTHKHAELRHLPPTLGFAPNQRVPALAANKQKVDNRQGTIDQDAEYMAFLEAETMPIPRAAAIDSAAAAEEKQKEAKVKSTPLIEDLRERKAKKATAAAAKAEKKGHARAESKDAKAVDGKEKEANNAGGGKKGEKKVEQAAKEAAKALNKQAAGKQAQANSAANASSAASSPQKGGQNPAKLSRRAAAAQAQQSPKPANAQTAASANGSTSPAAAQRGQQQRQRGNAEGIKKMLQKDLGIKPKPAAAQAQNNTAPSTTTAPAAPAKATPQPTPQPKPSQPPQLHKAYLKHANPSQGMTEILIQQALSAYGEMGNVTIDPRKGTAIAVFKTQEGMKKAVEAKKIAVAKGAVEVMEFRDRNGGRGQQGGVRGGGGGRGGRRGGGNVGNANGGHVGANAAAGGSGNAPAAAAG